MNFRKLYVAYGSNLNIEQMSRRCPDAYIYGYGYLNNWELIYRGSKTGSYASIRRKKGSRVPIALWSISARDERNLDRYEGYPVFYQKYNIYVELSDGFKKKAMVYIMDPSRRVGRPSEVYVNTIRQGYYDCGLDLDYLEESLEKNEYELGIFY